MIRAILFILIVWLPTKSWAQNKNHRIELDFSIKEKRSNGSFALQMGRAYYDLNYRKLAYDVSFPKKQTILTSDSTIFMVENGILIDKKSEPGYIEMSIFHLCLSGSMKDFGLTETAYEAKKVEHEDGMTMTTWEIPRKLKVGNGSKIITSIKDRKLFGIVYLDKDDQIISKQFYKDYETISGIEVPTKVIYILYVEGVEQYRIMEFKNIKINEFGNENFYNYTVPNSSK